MEKSNYKDSMFRMLYLDKKELLSLYNAVNGTDYTDADSFKHQCGKQCRAFGQM